MAEMLELLETIRSEQASIEKLFGAGDGVSVRDAANRKYHGRLVEAVRFIGEVFNGKRPMWQLKEAMSTSDFPYLFGDTIDRLLVADYKAIDPVWKAWIPTKTVPDFRAVKRFKVDGLTSVLGEVNQGEAYPEDHLDESYYTYAVKKYGRTFRILWEALVNDDLDALKDAPVKMARAAATTEAYVASGLYVANATLFTGGHGNYDTTVTLTIDNLRAAIAKMDAMTDPDSAPISNQMKYLVTGPALRLTALEICKSTLIMPWPGESGGTITAGARAVDNVLAGMLLPIVDPMIPVLDATYKATCWYLFADPADGAVAEVGFLRGHETPELFMKSSNQQRVGGGAVNPEEGDFETDAIAYKVRHVIGGTHTNGTGGWRFGYWARGA